MLDRYFSFFLLYPWADGLKRKSQDTNLSFSTEFEMMLKEVRTDPKFSYSVQKPDLTFLILRTFSMMKVLRTFSGPVLNDDVIEVPFLGYNAFFG